MCFTYCNLKVDGFVSNLSVNHSGLEERSEEKEFLNLSCGILNIQKHKQTSSDIYVLMNNSLALWNSWRY